MNKGDPYTLLLIFICHLASVMLVCDNGVQAKLKSVVLHLIEFHCVAHQLVRLTSL